MSLLDALLLDPPKPGTLDVYIALRTDGAKGSGTIDDPFDGSVQQAAAVTLATLGNVSPATREAVATTSSAHGYKNGDAVTITNASNSAFNGTFPVYGINEADPNTASFKYYLQSDPGSVPTVTGAKHAKLTYRFDDVMNQVLASSSANVAIRIGPGTFETRGHAEGVSYPGWKPKAGQTIKMFGSGIDVTWFKIMYASQVDRLYLFVGRDYSDYLLSFEASDFSVDCNLSGQLNLSGQYVDLIYFRNVADRPQVACGAVGVSGRHVRLRRIRAIHFGTQSYPECFVITAAQVHPGLDAAGQHTFDCVIEDCIIEKPSEHNTHESSLFVLGGLVGDAVAPMVFHRACIIRNCFVDCAYESDGLAHHEVRFQALNADGGTAAVAENNRIFNCSVGCYHDTWTSRDLTIRNNHFSNVRTGVYQNLDGFALPLSSPLARINDGVWKGVFTTILPLTQLVVSARGAGLFAGDKVTVSRAEYPGTGSFTNPYNVTMADVTVPPGSTNTFLYPINTAYDPNYNAAGFPIFKIYNSSGTLIYDPERVISSLIQDSANPLKAKATTATDHNLSVGQFVSVYGATGVSPVKYALYNGLFRVDSMPSSKDFTYLMTADPGGDADASAAKCAPQLGTPLIPDASGQVATFTTANQHGLSTTEGSMPGRGVIVAGAWVGNPSTNTNPFNATLAEVASTPTDYSFTYNLPSNPGGNAFGPATAKVKYQDMRLLIEGNIFELTTYALAARQ